jgi:hypothetical protein
MRASAPPDESPMNSIEFNDQRYRRSWTELQDLLRRLPLSAALTWLFEQQLDAGFIRDDLRALRRYKFEVKEDQTYYIAQHNPARERRHEGAGRSVAPAGRGFINGGCFLCPPNVEIQQSGLELGCEIAVGARNYVAWPNTRCLPIATRTRRRDSPTAVVRGSRIG